MNTRTLALEIGINNDLLAIAVFVAVYIDNPGAGQILLVTALYSLFIVIISTGVTMVFRRANLAAEQKIPNLL
jgi:predicted Na+-dependent transporter